MKQKRTKLEKREKIQATLEGYRRFDYDYIPFGHRWVMPDGKHRYRLNVFDRALGAIVRFLLCTLGTLVIKAVYGARVTGRKNKKAIKGKGAFCVCNHFSFLDTLFVRSAAGHFRSYHTAAPYNNKRGIGGWFLRRGGLLPFSGNLAATKNLMREMERLLGAGKIVNFYAEQAMWVNYQKPRPMKEGAFYYAVRYNVPVLPVFCTFKKTKRGHIRKLRINILPPVFADETLPRNARIAKMKEDCERACRECYEKAYGKPLEYLPDVRKHSRQ